MLGHGISFRLQFFKSFGNHLVRVFIQRKVVNNAPLTVLEDNRIGEEKALINSCNTVSKILTEIGCTILSLGLYSDRGPVRSGTKVPVSDVVDQRGSGRGGAGRASGGDNGSSTLLYGRCENILVPLVIVDDAESGLSLDGGMGEVGELGGAVVTPDGKLGDIREFATSLFNDLGHTTVVILSVLKHDQTE